MKRSLRKKRFLKALEIGLMLIVALFFMVNSIQAQTNNNFNLLYNYGNFVNYNSWFSFSLFDYQNNFSNFGGWSQSNGGFSPYYYSLLPGTLNLGPYPSMSMISGFGHFDSGLAIRSLYKSALGNYPFMGIDSFLNIPTSQEIKGDSDAEQSPEAEGEITEEQCSGGLAVEDPMSNCINLSSPDFEDLEIVFCTQKAEYSSLDSCIPISIVISNTGSDDIHLSEDQAEEIANDYIGVYTNTRFMKVYLDQTAGPAIQPGLFLKPGESATLSAMLDRDRVALYTAPPLSGGFVTRNVNFQGPWGTLGLGRIDISIDIDFGELPDSRAYDPGAGTDFVAGTLIVGFKEGVTVEEVEAFVDKYRCHIKKILELISSALFAEICIPFELTTGEVMDVMLSDPDCSEFIKYIERNGLGQIIWY